MKIYLVGGAVRDKLLNRNIKERDFVVVGATPQQMVDLGFKQVGKDFPVFLHPETHEEYALARTERKIGRGYTEFSVHAAPDVTLEEDLGRRDLTINAMAETLEGELVDPYGGLSDLQNKILRHVSPAFLEDPVRILRVARFGARYASLGFTIAKETLLLMQEMVANGEVDFLVPERVWQECQRALHEDSPQIFFSILRECNALAKLFPELDCLFGVPNPPQWHPEIDTGVHVLMVLEQAAKLSKQGAMRFAALLHDVGKGITPPENWPKHPGHENSGTDIIKNLCKRLRVPQAYRELAILTCRYHGHCHRALELTSATLLKTLEALDAFRRPRRFQEFLLACEADSRGRTGYEHNPYPQRQFMEQAFHAANAVLVAPLLERGLQDKKLGDELHRLRVAAIEKSRNLQAF